MNFEKAYPQLDIWVKNRGWIEIGADENSDSWIRILDEGGMVWESEDKSLNKSLKSAELFLEEYLNDN